MFGEQVAQGGFSLAGDPHFTRAAADYGFLSGRSTHADRVATINECYTKYGVLIDPHTADGVKVARDWADHVLSPIVCLETALPVKFAETITEAIGQVPKVPARFAEIMSADRHVVDLSNDIDVVKAYISDNA